MKTYYQLQPYYTDTKTKWIAHETRSLNNARKIKKQLLKAWAIHKNIKIRIIKVTEEVVK